jgi:hypothetical protein
LGDVLFEHLYQSRFANPSLSAQQHHLTLSILGLVPTFQQKSDVLLSPNQWCQTTRTGYIQATLGTTVSQDAIHCDGLLNPSQRLLA